MVGPNTKGAALYYGYLDIMLKKKHCFKSDAQNVSTQANWCGYDNYMLIVCVTYSIIEVHVKFVPQSMMVSGIIPPFEHHHIMLTKFDLIPLEGVLESFFYKPHYVWPVGGAMTRITIGMCKRLWLIEHVNYGPRCTM